jgi:hypothetical protein
MVAGLSVHGQSLETDKPRLWSERQILPTTLSQQDFDVAPDGRYVVALVSPDSAVEPKKSVHVMVVLNFIDDVRRRIPAPK